MGKPSVDSLHAFAGLVILSKAQADKLCFFELQVCVSAHQLFSVFSALRLKHKAHAFLSQLTQTVHHDFPHRYTLLELALCLL